MSDTPSNLNDQITDAVIAVNEIVLGSAPAEAMSSMYLTLAQAAGVSTQNAVANQQLQNVLSNVATAAATAGILSIGFGNAKKEPSPDELINLLQKLLKAGSGDDSTSGDSKNGGDDGKSGDDGKNGQTTNGGNTK